PTWNYTAVHVYGIPNILTEETKLVKAIETLTHIHEAKSKTSWEPKYPSNMLKTIVGFEIHVQKVESKFKLSQNRPKADRDNVTYELLRSEIDRDKDLGKLMMKNQS
ncbi:MAG TPA: FMN-binding negative transcriptional regulator, partial [Spirochaetes bacterium]|nr:FMN-binding negative transcriptional regulator [Spirochaetota bacterium]